MLSRPAHTSRLITAVNGNIVHSQIPREKMPKPAQAEIIGPEPNSTILEKEKAHGKAFRGLLSARV
jgi:hypothetical protein